MGREPEMDDGVTKKDRQMDRGRTDTDGGMDRVERTERDRLTDREIE